MEARFQREANYVKVEVTGRLQLTPFLGVIRRAGDLTREGGDTLALFDLRKLETDLNAAAQMKIGDEVAQHLAHLRKVASVVPTEKITRASERVARARGLQLRVFDTLPDAHGWLVSDEREADGASATMDAVRAVFWETFQPLFPAHAQAVQTENGALVISWPLGSDPNAVYDMATPITVRFEAELLDQMRLAPLDQRRRLAKQQEAAFRAGLIGYDPYASVPKARVIVLG
jgi:hypothetical protein